MESAAAHKKAVSPVRLLALLALAFAILAGSATLRTSATFDEIVFMCAGARGFHSGAFGLVVDQPRMAEYLYGLPVYLAGVVYPPEILFVRDTMPHYYYARTLLWGLGNPAQQLITLARLVALFFGTATVVLAFFAARRHMAPGAALFAAALVAFLPDMLAHSGVAYNDIPLVFGFLACLYIFDATVRRPSPGRVIFAGVACALTVCVKFSGLILGPILVTLVALEAISGRRRDAAWLRGIAIAVPVFLVAMYVTMVLVYLGDWRLELFTKELQESFRLAVGREANLFGERYVDGRWYFFPVAFLLKTPAALHLLALVACVGGAMALSRTPWRQWISHGARAPSVGVAFFLAGLVTSHMNIGFRHALPMLPPLCILVAQGAWLVWKRGRPALRAALGIVFASYLASSVSHYPYFLGYLSEYTAGRPSYETLVDSSTDWGQGLVALRDFMRERKIDAVALGYFGSALPDGYGIRYYPLPSYYQLPQADPSLQPPRYMAVSATVLAGLYVKGDPYQKLRGRKPVAVLAGSLYVYDTAALQ